MSITALFYIFAMIAVAAIIMAAIITAVSIMMTALIAALEWADGNDKLNPSDSLRRRPASTLTAETFLSQPPRPGVLMGRRKSLSQSQIRRTIKAVSDTGLKVKKVIIGPDGTLSIESDDSQSADRSKKPLASWEE